jgi:hypothetical protein
MHGLDEVVGQVSREIPTETTRQFIVFSDLGLGAAPIVHALDERVQLTIARDLPPRYGGVAANGYRRWHRPSPMETSPSMTATATRDDDRLARLHRYLDELTREHTTAVRDEPAQAVHVADAIADLQVMIRRLEAPRRGTFANARDARVTHGSPDTRLRTGPWPQATLD